MMHEFYFKCLWHSIWLQVSRCFLQAVLYINFQWHRYDTATQLLSMCAAVIWASEQRSKTALIWDLPTAAVRAPGERITWINHRKRPGFGQVMRCAVTPVVWSRERTGEEQENLTSTCFFELVPLFWSWGSWLLNDRQTCDLFTFSHVKLTERMDECFKWCLVVVWRKCCRNTWKVPLCSVLSEVPQTEVSCPLREVDVQSNFHLNCFHL